MTMPDLMDAAKEDATQKPEKTYAVAQRVESGKKGSVVGARYRIVWKCETFAEADVVCHNKNLGKKRQEWFVMRKSVKKGVEAWRVVKRMDLR